MAARSSALGGRGQNRVWARSACPVVSLVAGADLRACVRLTPRSAGAGPRIPMRLCLRDELPAVPGRSYWRVVFDFVAFSDVGVRGSGRPECCPVWSLAGLAACIEVGQGSHGRCRGRQAAAAMHAAPGVDGMSRLLSCPRRSQCVAMHPAVGRARSRRYLKSALGCLRCSFTDR